MDEEDPPPEDLEQLQCDPSATVPAVAMRRLSRRQLHRTIDDLVTLSMGAHAQSVRDEIDWALQAWPQDLPTTAPGRKRGGFRRLDQAVHQAHIDAANTLGVELGRAMTASEARVEALMGSCATDGDASNDEACVVDFIDAFGRRALRRPLTDADRAFYVDVFVGDAITSLDPAAVGDVIAVMVASPQLQYFVEHGTDAVEGVADTYWLSDYELASRLSFHFWQTMPDEALLAAAERGELSTQEGWAAQVDRVFADPRTRASLREFFRESWWLDDVAPLDARVGTPVFDAFLGSFEPCPYITAHMVDEVLDMALFYAVDTEGTLDDILLSDRSFAKTEDVAQIYDVAPWDGTSEPPAFDDPQRRGLVTRAALLVSGSANTRPVMKGLFVREGLLCDEIPPPPDNAAANPPQLSSEQTTREVVEALTEGEGTACAGCHAPLINPMGYVTENFDALGRARAEQVLLDEEGNEVGRKAVKTEAVPRVDLQSDEVAQGAADLSQMLADSGRPHVCLARQWVRFSLGRIENDDTDACMIEDVAQRLLDGESLGVALRQIALRPEFRQRAFVQDGA